MTDFSVGDIIRARMTTVTLRVHREYEVESLNKETGKVRLIGQRSTNPTGLYDLAMFTLIRASSINNWQKEMGDT